METLNEQQQLAVRTIEGPLQILAGAGSGKTKVIINRIAHIIRSGGSPSNILALTFTNKAANEMKTRLFHLMGETYPYMWIGTFHSICLKILRTHIDKIGYSRDFVIYDHYDQQTLVKDCMKELKVNAEVMKPAYFLSVISSAKDELITPIKYEEKFAVDIRTKTASKVYKMYQERLKKNNAVDFDDMIFLTIKILKDHPEILSFYQDKFQYIMVDEYQDTNHSQYVLIHLLAQKYRNICVVGDDDQAIYGWRGADIRNILDFANDYSDAVIVKLEQNYRSTQNILTAANHVIEKNTGRKKKKLWTQNKSDIKIELIKSQDDRMEAKNVAREIRSLRSSFDNKDIAILYRTNVQSRLLEEELIKAQISYNIYGGLKFYDRKEIKDILAYLRIIANPSDDISLKRIINTPKRGLGIKTLEKVEIQANIKGESLFSALLDHEELDISTRAQNAIRTFVLLISSLRSMSEVIPIEELIEKIVANSGYIKELEEEGEIEFQTRLENINELRSVAQEFTSSSEDRSLEAFLSTVALSSDIDVYEEGEDTVTLMTLHSSKGLEFPVVFITGMEEGIFPSAKSLMSDIQIEEERRLCYVGMTRAKERLYLSYAHSRNYFGKYSSQIVSRFIKDVPQELLNGKVDRTATSGSGGYSLVDKYKKKREMMAQVDTGPKVVDQFEMGEQVIHPSFGKGKIVAKSDSSYTIVFGGSGIKKIDINFDKLTKA
ncbi:MAG: UvrD-helicase domain-containing protein [Peptostreptococcaceae bacterium]|nr:UvrD-helicase domain-containing protein [Peptostreptococcaceae bacterium]